VNAALTDLGVQIITMSKTKQQNRSELEHLRGEVKRLKSINRQLRKRLKKYEQKETWYLELEDDIQIPTQEPAIDFKKCSDCGKGVIMEQEYKFVIVAKCDTCGFTTRRKPTDHGQKKKT